MHDEKTHEPVIVIQQGNPELAETAFQKKPGSLRKDLGSIVFLTYMYFLYTIPFGMDRSMPLILSGRKLPYEMQGTFCLACLPYSMKILW
jgi:hypothetical protein